LRKNARDAMSGLPLYMRLQDVGSADNGQLRPPPGEQFRRRRVAMRRRGDERRVGENLARDRPYGVHDDLVADIVRVDRGIEHVDQHVGIRFLLQW
jgi:hypothetical protein